MVAAADTLTEAAGLLRLIAEPEWLAHVLLRLGYSVHYADGDLESALARTREAVDAAPLGARERATVLTFLSDVLIYAFELDEAEAVLRSVADVARRLRDQRLLGYHAWERASIASRRGDSGAVTTWVAEALRHPGDWYEHPTGIEFLADVVDMYGRIGDLDQAARYLARVEERCSADRHEGVDQIALFARATHGARAGDPSAAERDLAAVLDSQQLPPREMWRIYLLRGLAAARAGDESAAGAFAARAFEEAAAIGHPELPSLHEPAVFELLLPLARRTGSSAVESAQSAEPALAVRLLGEFTVSASGRPVAPPPGRPQTLVKLLAVSGGPVAVDEVIEVLWPEIDPDTGRARLRNVLSRIRSSCGELIRRDGEALVLSTDVTVDALEFDREARAALSAPPDQANEIARRAIARYAGELLPSDRYEDFTVAPRERLALRYLALLDRLAGDAERSEDIDEALRLYGEAIAAAPLDEHRYEKAATLAMKSGRRRRAVELFEQARRALAELGVEPSQELARIVGASRG
jgi:DNA-binding SARP family transcriptional activator